MTEEKTLGILLQSIPYLGEKRILKVFTPHQGMISVFAKSKNLKSLTIPFCLAEWVYKKGQKEMFDLKDGTLLDSFLPLRENYATLLAAGAIAKDLLRSQLPNKSAPAIYALLFSFFQKLPAFPYPETLVTAFRLKVLLHEGLLALQTHCTACPLSASHLFEGESYCQSHAPPGSFAFTPAEWNELHNLAFARSFSELQVPASSRTKVALIFESKVRGCL